VRTEPACDLLVIGGGLAGLASALHAAEAGFSVKLLVKKPFDECSSAWAQGGIAAAVGPDDDPELHVADTLDAGAGLCKVDSVKFLAQQAPGAIAWLREQHVAFTEMPDDHAALHLTREGGHSRRRVVHAADATGQAIMDAVTVQVLQHPSITVCTRQIAIDLIRSDKVSEGADKRCVGAYALDVSKNKVVTHAARAVLLATGGASKMYLYTTNPDTSTGDGIAMAWRAGCRVANMEFMQFHPTCLYHPHAKSMLISEAVRGEGGLLVLPNGKRFMDAHDPRGELAPRDIVARAIDFEMKRGGYDCVYLDITHKPAKEILEHFPNIARRCQEFGIDITREPIPVVPAAHYTCGGVITDLDARTDLPGLFAVGECTSTGIHGANRLASNSLLECCVFAESAIKRLQKELSNGTPPPPPLPAWDESRVTDADEHIVVSHNWDELRHFMWDYVGIVRTNKRLQRALRRIELLKTEIAEYYGNFRVTSDLIELRNLTTVAEMTVRCAMSRPESRGLHFNRDYPKTLPADQVRDSILVPEE
jgi:L-aspartate oxidase